MFSHSRTCIKTWNINTTLCVCIHCDRCWFKLDQFKLKLKFVSDNWSLISLTYQNSVSLGWQSCLIGMIHIVHGNPVLFTRETSKKLWFWANVNTDLWLNYLIVFDCEFWSLSLTIDHYKWMDWSSFASSKVITHWPVCQYQQGILLILSALLIIDVNFCNTLRDQRPIKLFLDIIVTIFTLKNQEK